MTREEIIRMAREAAFYDGEIGRAEDSFVHFAALVAAVEREACAKVAEAWPFNTPEQIAAAIRARGNT